MDNFGFSCEDLQITLRHLASVNAASGGLHLQCNAEQCDAAIQSNPIDPNLVAARRVCTDRPLLVTRR